MRLTPRLHSAAKTPAWPATIGLAALLFLAATARLGLRPGPGADGRIPPASPSTPLRLTVSADGALLVGGAAVAREGLAARLAAEGPVRPVELAVDRRAPGAAVDGLLIRLLDAGVSSCTLRVEVPPASGQAPGGSTPAAASSASGAGGESRP